MKNLLEIKKAQLAKAADSKIKQQGYNIHPTRTIGY